MIASGTSEEVIIAGFGGQGVLMLGKILATGAMRENYQITYMPSYGAEVRGGTANCMVKITDEPIASPLVSQPDSVIVMNAASLHKFTPRLKPGGVLIMNSSLTDSVPERDDIEIISVPADELALELGSVKSANMVALGAYLQKRQIINLQTVGACLGDVLASRHHSTIPTNLEALRRGAKIVQDSHN